MKQHRLSSLALALLLCLSSLCGFAVTTQALTEGNFTYTISDGEATITGYFGSATSLVIPGTIGGYPVTAIGEYSMPSHNSIQSITFPNSLVAIGNQAFEGCESLISVNFGSGVKYIGDEAFKHCTYLQTVSIPNSTLSIGEGSFAFCVYLRNLTIGNNVSSIGDYAFYGCMRLTEVSIPMSVTYIGDYTFCDTQNLTGIFVDEQNANYCDIDGVLYDKSISRLIKCPAGKRASSCTLPKTVKGISGGAFDYCPNLSEIKVDEASESFKSEDGVLLNKQGTCLIKYPVNKSGTNYSISNGVTTISDGAFYRCVTLEAVTIPDGVTSIGTESFYYCTSLQSVTLPSSIEKIGNAAFSLCISLSSVYFRNVPPVTFGKSVFLGCATDFTIYYPRMYSMAWTPNGEMVWNGYPIAPYDYAPPYYRGDANGNGTVDSADAAHILRYVVRIIQSSEIDLKAANVNGDNSIDAADASKILRWVVKLIPSLA